MINKYNIWRLKEYGLIIDNWYSFSEAIYQEGNYIIKIIATASAYEAHIYKQQDNLEEIQLDYVPFVLLSKVAELTNYGITFT